MRRRLHRPPKAPPYCHGFTDRHGNPRWYYRRRGYPLTPLPGMPWTPEFMAAHEAASKGQPLEIGKAMTKPGTIAALIVSYYKSPDFTGLKPTTQKTYRNILERFREDDGDKRVAMLQRQHVQKLVNDRGDVPTAANRLLQLMHLLMRHAVETGLRRDDPTIGVRKVREKAGGFTTWEEHHIAAFLDHHKPGTRAYSALTLLLYTGQRRGDVVKLGRQNLRDGFLGLVQGKTGQEVHIPLHRDLAALIDTLPADAPAFLTGERGKPLTPEAFTNWFRQMVKDAGLPDGLSPHGLRKAACRRLAEAGCSPHEIMSISGHKTLAEVTRYTVAASRKGMAERAVAALDRDRTKAG